MGVGEMAPIRLMFSTLVSIFKATVKSCCHHGSFPEVYKQYMAFIKVKIADQQICFILNESLDVLGTPHCYRIVDSG